MHPFQRIKTEEQLAKLSYDLDIARAKVYQNWGFTVEEIACLVDLPESVIRLEFSKDALTKQVISAVKEEK
jgi:hypothetical protein